MKRIFPIKNYREYIYERNKNRSKQQPIYPNPKLLQEAEDLYLETS